MTVSRIIVGTEKFFLVLIAAFTVVAMAQQILLLAQVGKVELKDLLLMFIYSEVLGMLAAFYVRHSIPIQLPLFIGITAVSRLIVLQGKEVDASALVYESSAILLLATACWVVGRLRPED
jgi:protein PsiE